MNISIGTRVSELTYSRDQASVLVQLGLLDPANLPVLGVETAMKLLDESSVQSNQLMRNWNESEGEPI
jgi:carboxymethylenebutenolidase